MEKSTMQMIREGQAAERKLDQGLRQNFSMTCPQYTVLKVLTDNGGPIAIGKVADTLNCSRGNLTSVCDRLERDGWIERDRSKEDRRIVHIRLTEKDFAAVDAWVQSQN